jgi:glycosyltransferase involved in cell wall biosynthesis
MNERVHPQAPLRTETLRCLYISRYAPIRTQTDPYTGLPWYLSQQTSLTGIWSKPERGSVAFKPACQSAIEVTGTTKPDVVVCGIDEHSLSLAVLMGKMAGIPVYAFAEDPPFTNRYNGFPSIGRRAERELRRKIISMLLERCSGIFCFVEKEALKDFNIRGVPLHQMMNGPSAKALTWFEENPQMAANGGDFIVGLVGALCKEQGLDTLLEIIAEASKRIRGLKVRLIGPMDPDYGEVFYEKVRRLGLQSAIEVTGWLSYPIMLERLSGCSVGVYCNPDTDWYRVAQPLKICEYLALAKTVIAWDYPGTRRLLDQGRLGVLVPSGDVFAFADALVRLRDPTVRMAIEKEIRTATMHRWSATYWYGETLRIMQEYVGGTKT